MTIKILNSMVIALVLLAQGIGGKEGVGGKGGIGGGHQPLNPCLTSAWAMNEGSGLTLNDASGNANTATISGAGAVTWTANAIKSGVTSPVWTGTGDAVAASSTVNNFDGTTPFSVFMWVKSTATPPWRFMTNSSGGTGFPGFYIDQNPGGLGGPQMTITLASNLGTGNYIQASILGSVVDGAIHYIGFTYDGSKTLSGLKIYYDGALGTNSSTTNGLTGSMASGTPVTFAAGTGGGSNYNGGMGYVAIYNCAIDSFVSTYFARGPQLN